MLEALLALGLLLASASQFRLGGLPVGPGELCLASWVVLASCRAAGERGSALTPALSRMMIFWAALFLAESLGTLTGLLMGEAYDPSWFLHDTVAYPLMAAISVLPLIGREAGCRLDRANRFLVALGTLCLAPQLAAACGLLDLPFINVWFGDRFRGWSNNPNQLGDLCAILLLLALHLADTARSTCGRVAALASMALPIWVGRLTKEDTFTFILVAAGPVFILMKLWSWLPSPGERRTARSDVAVVVLAVAPLLVAAIAPVAVAGLGNFQTVGMGMMKDGGREAQEEADLRLELWHEAISRGFHSGLLGLGPGPHLYIPASITAARVSDPGLDTGDHPVQNGTPNFEAHNTLFDLFTQGGIIAVAAFLWLCTTAFVTAYKARRASLVTVLSGMALAMMTGLIIRHPTFWFAMALCLIAEPRKERNVGRYQPTPRRQASLTRAVAGMERLQPTGSAREHQWWSNAKTS